MARFYLHLDECGSVCVDEFGADYANLDAAKAAAIMGAREVMSAEVRQGQLCLSCHISIEDERHVEVFRISFRDLVHVTGLSG